MSKQGVLVETLNGLETIKATGSSGLMKKRFEEATSGQSDLGFQGLVRLLNLQLTLRNQYSNLHRLLLFFMVFF